MIQVTMIRSRRLKRFLFGLTLLLMGYFVYKQEQHNSRHREHALLPGEAYEYPIGMFFESSEKKSQRMRRAVIRKRRRVFPHGDHRGTLMSSLRKSSDYVEFGPPIIALGDSLTEYAMSVEEKGWVALLADTFRRRFDVFNRGYAGYTTDQYVHMVSDVILDIIGEGPCPTFTTLMLGTNDANIHSSRGVVPIDQYKDNLHVMLQLIRDLCPKTPLLVMTPPPVTLCENADPQLVFQYRSAMLSTFRDPVYHGRRRKPRTRQPEASRHSRKDSRHQRKDEMDEEEEEVSVNGLSRNVFSRRIFSSPSSLFKSPKPTLSTITARSNYRYQYDPGLIVLDTWPLFFPGTTTESFSLERDYNATSLKAYLKDGIHFTENGNRVLFQGVMKTLKREFPSLYRSVKSLSLAGK